MTQEEFQDLPSGTLVCSRMNYYLKIAKADNYNWVDIFTGEINHFSSLIEDATIISWNEVMF